VAFPSLDPNAPDDGLEPEAPAFEVHRLDGQTWAVLGAGAALTALVLALPWPRFALSYLTTLIHEFGHALVGWAFGYPSVPRFDFTYGGGVTTMQGRSTLILGIVYVLLGLAVVSYRRNRPTLIALAAGLGLFALCAHTDLHRVIILFMGHGMELVIAAVFLYRALSASAVVHALERPLYAMCGFFILASDLHFGWRLMTSPAARRAYGAAKGGGHWMDFDRIARHLHVGLPTIAFVFLACCLLAALIAFLIYRYQDRLFDLLARRVDGQLP
jgi:hypothetical protein